MGGGGGKRDSTPALSTWRESQLISASTSLHISGDFVKQCVFFLFFGTNIYNYISNRHVCFHPG